MTHGIIRRFCRSAAIGIAALTFGGATAEAGWWHHGGHGGSYGSYSGGYGYGSYGRVGSGSYGGLFGHWHHHHARWHGSYGSYGGSHGYHVASYGSSGGSYGSSGGGYANRSWGSSGGHYGSNGSSGGSSGTQYYTAPNYVPGTGSPYYTTPSQMATATPATPDSSAKPALDSDLPAPGADANPANGSATLTINVPGEALVYVNGVQTRSTGELRRYISRGLSDGFSYTYDIRATMVQNGRVVEENKVVQLRAGDETQLAFAFNAKGTVETTLTLKVPENATVALAGSKTNMSGQVRVFKTFALDEGTAWDDYKVIVTVDREGELVSQEKTITLKAGDSQTLSFDFDNAQVAAR